MLQVGPAHTQDHGPNACAELDRIARYYSNIITVIVWDVSHSWKPGSGTLSRLRNLHPRSTQNTDAVSSINFPNSSVSCLLYIYLIQLKQSISMLLRILGRYSDNDSTIYQQAVIIYTVNNNNDSKQQQLPCIR